MSGIVLLLAFELIPNHVSELLHSAINVVHVNTIALGLQLARQVVHPESFLAEQTTTSTLGCSEATFAANVERFSGLDAAHLLDRVEKSCRRSGFLGTRSSTRSPLQFHLPSGSAYISCAL